MMKIKRSVVGRQRIFFLEVTAYSEEEVSSLFSERTVFSEGILFSEEILS